MTKLRKPRYQRWKASGLWKATQALKKMKGLDGKPTGIQK